MTLEDTIRLMLSESLIERIEAEYHQTRIRLNDSPHEIDLAKIKQKQIRDNGSDTSVIDKNIKLLERREEILKEYKSLLKEILMENKVPLD